MLKIGLTGGLGSGKTSVAAIFEVLGIPVYYADIAAKTLMNENKAIKDSIQNHFSSEVYLDGNLNREFLAQQVFNDEKKLALLNSIVHPATIKDANEWIKKQSSPYIIKEAALLFESGSNNFLDFIIGVSAPLDLRIKRAMKRDNISEQQVMARINKQMPEEEKLALCDFIIINDEEHMILPQVLALHQKFAPAPSPGAGKIFL